MAEIRRREQASARPLLTTIAFTSHALEGDREKSLLEGMDHFLNTPIERQKLLAALDSPGATAPLPSLNVMNQNETEFAFDPAVMLKRVDGDRELLREVATLFIEDTPRLLAEIRGAISQTDARTLERSAHTLKGSVGNFGARVASEAALALEMMGRTGDFVRALEEFTCLESQISRLVPALQILLKVPAA